jgi:hypothetical protein
MLFLNCAGLCRVMHQAWYLDAVDGQTIRLLNNDDTTRRFYHHLNQILYI